PATDDREPVTVAYPQPFDDTPAAPEEDKPDVAATWQPEPAGDEIMEIASDESEDEFVPIRKPKRRAKPKRKKQKTQEPPHTPQSDGPTEERPHEVSVVRGKQLQHPFADTSWQELVDDDDDEPIVVTDDSPDDEEPPFDTDDEAEAWPDETLFQESDDWDAPGGDDEFEAA
ncbi:MAG TPA: hypothetical protein VFI31_17155, partial [Pirellulales bacterium]|nr:hypothetical protein [Pirellulales bacterium]